MIHSSILKGICNLDITNEYSNLGASNTLLENSLSFLDSEQFLDEINKNKNIKGVITISEFYDRISNDKEKIISKDPRYDYYTIHNFIAKKNKVLRPSNIDPSAQIHPKAYVAENNVVIGPNTIIHPNATILEDVEIGANCSIGAGTVIGSEGFEYKRTSKGIISVIHDGKVIIGNNVEIGTNNSIDKGFINRNTIIEENVKIDNLIHIAHCVHIKPRSFIIAGTVLGGSTTIEEDCWTGINSSTAPFTIINKRGFLSMGAVVTKDVMEGQQVTGNFAIDHKTFLNNLKRSLK